MPQKIKSDVTLGQNIRSIRKSKKLTQEQVSTKMQLLGIDITRSIYSQIECGTYLFIWRQLTMAMYMNLCVWIFSCIGSCKKRMQYIRIVSD